MKIIKKILAALLMASILLSTVLPIAAFEVTDVGQIIDSGISGIMNSASDNPLKGDESLPFNSAQGSPVLINKENELLLYTSNKHGRSEKDDFITIFEHMDQNSSYLGEGDICPEIDMFFVTAVALDASGNGTEDHVAYLGVKAFDSNDKGANATRFGEQVLMLTLYNARKNRVVDTIEIGDVKDWINSVQHYAYKTLISVTAGDYDGDGIDEIACTDADMGVQMIEIVKNDSKLTLLKSERYDWTDLVSENVAYEMKKSVTADAEYNRRAFISLATGNLDGTGAEELAVAVSTNHPGDKDLMPDIPEAYTTQVAMLASPLSKDVIIRTDAVYSARLSSTDEEDLDNLIYRMLYVGQISCGDLDGDRRDEIAITGYTGEIEVTETGEFVYGRYEYDTSNIALCYAKCDGDIFDVSEISIDVMTPFIEEGFFDNSDGLVPLAIDAAKLHGQYGKESVFVGGKVYQFSIDGATPLHTHSFFEDESSFTVTDAYVEHVTSGVFGGADELNGDKPMINEQFVFTVVEKDSGQNEYSYKVGFISMSTNPETEMTNFADNTETMNSDGYLLEELEGGLKTSWGNTDTSYGTALIPVAVDIDNDGLLVKHTNTTYFYEDPSVEVILQAAPHFDELGGWDEFNSSTTYSVSVSRSLIDISGHTHSIHVGLKGKLGFGQDAGELELKVGYALDLDYEHETAYTTTYTTTFEAGSYDTVVLQRTPYICYEYSYVDINGNLLTGEEAGSVVLMEALQPVYYQLSVDEYNRFVDEYNAIADRHDKEGVTNDGNTVETIGDSYRLVKITDDILPTDATGNPGKYYSYLHGGEYISQSTYALGYNGGFTTSDFSYEVEKTYTAKYAHGMHFELEGVGKVGAIGPVSFNIGAFAALSFQKTSGYGDASVNGTATGGTVANIVPSNYSEMEQDTLKQFGFNWRCALWKKSLMTDIYGNPYCDADGNPIKIPVVGYVVTNVKSPMPAPKGVEAYLSGNGYQVTVDWSLPNGGEDTLMGYYIYRSCDNQAPICVNSDILPSTATSFVDTSALRSGKIYTYYVIARYDSPGGEYTTMNPKSSSVVFGIPIIPDGGNDASGTDQFTASIMGDGSFAVIMSLLALVVSAAAVGIVFMYKKKEEVPTEQEETE